jgi:DNA polymerase-4
VKTILHVDMDAFFVSVEELYDPSLKGKPVVVGAELVRRGGKLTAPRGVVSAASYAARRYGVHSAMPLAQAYKLCPHAVFLPVNRQRYSDASEKIERIFRSFSPHVEMVSVDEAYIDLSGAERLWGPPMDAATRLHQEVRRQTSLPCSIGVSTSRLVAKVASEQAKPNGILAVVPGEEAKFLGPLPVRRIPGVGKRTEEHLERLGIRTVADVARAGPKLLQEVFGAYGAALFRKSAGEDAGGWFEGDFGEEEEPKSIGHETTFDEDTADRSRLEATLSELSQMVAHRLRQHRLFARTVTLKLRDSDFHTITRAHTLAEPTDLDGPIFSAATELFQANWNKRKVRLLGVQASGLEQSPGQMSLLDHDRLQKWQKALEATDRLRDRFGFDSVRLAGSLKKTEPED